MPELPEVDVARRDLTAWTAGRRLRGVRIVDPAVVGGDGAERLAEARGAVVVGPRVGKRLGLQLGGVGLVTHLGMSGRWVRREETEVPRWGRLGLTLDDGATVWLVDPRRLGGVRVVDDVAAAVQEGLGPDALGPWTGEALRARLGGTAALKVQLMDQARIAGLGNLHVVEALHRAGISPFAAPRALDVAAWNRLADAIGDQLRAAIEEGLGEGDVAYLSDGTHVANPFRIYGRAGKPCPVCGTAVQRAVQAGRSTVWCPACQPDPGPDAVGGRDRRGAAR